jgi:hypothetical protein
MTFAEVQQGHTLIVNGSHFVAASQVIINTTPLSAAVVSDQQLKVTLSSDVISGPGIEGERAYSQWELRRRGLYQWRDQQCTRINRQLSSVHSVRDRCAPQARKGVARLKVPPFHCPKSLSLSASQVRESKSVNQ